MESRSKSRLSSLFIKRLQQYDSLVRPIRLRGLQPDGRYQLDGGEVVSGAVLMNHGIAPVLTGDYASTLIHLQLVG